MSSGARFFSVSFEQNTAQKVWFLFKKFCKCLQLMDVIKLTVRLIELEILRVIHSVYSFSKWCKFMNGNGLIIP